MVLPADLNDLLNRLNSLNLTSPDGLNQLRGLQNQLDNINQQLGQNGFTTQSFRIEANPDKKVQKLLERREAVLQEMQATWSALQTALQPLDAQLADTVSLVTNHYDYLLHRYEGGYRPRSLEQYKHKFDRAEGKFYLLTHTRNTQDMLMAGFIPVLEMQLYRLLLDDLRAGQLPATYDTDMRDYVYGFEGVQTISNAHQFAEKLLRRVEKHRLKLGKLQAAMQRKLDRLLALPPRGNAPVPIRPQDVMEEATLQAEEAPDEFEAGFAASRTQSSFTILSHSPAGEPQVLDADEGGPGTGGAPILLPGKPGPGSGFSNPLTGLTAAIGAAVSLFRDQVRDLFNRGYRWLCPAPIPTPTPTPEPTLIPAPTPTPSNFWPNECFDPGVQRLSSEDLEGKISNKAFNRAVKTAGSGSTPIADVDRLVAQYGGQPSDWRKMVLDDRDHFDLGTEPCAPGDANQVQRFNPSSEEDGNIYDSHWYERTGPNGEILRYEFKLKEQAR